jgi:acetyl-CoA carboxylase carboxyl transferase subunit beta
MPVGPPSAEFLLAHGQIDMIRQRSALRRTLGRLLAVHRVDGPTGRPVVPVAREPVPWPDADVWQHMRRPTDIDRPTTLDYLGLVFDDFEELRGDRVGADRAAIVGGLARLDGVPVLALGHQNGPEPTPGEHRPDGHRKVARLLRLAAKLGLPVVTFVDTPGARAGTESEEAVQAVTVAENIRLMAALPAPVIALITGEGGGIGGLALEFADEVLICANAGYSVTRSNEAGVAVAPRLDARQLLRLGMADRVVAEPDGGCQADHELAARHVREALRASLRALLTVDGRTLVANRRTKFRSFSATAAAGVRPEGE